MALTTVVGLAQPKKRNWQSSLDDASVHLLDSICRRVESGADHFSQRRPGEVESHTVVSRITRSHPLSDRPMKGMSPLFVQAIVGTCSRLDQCESVVQSFQST